MSVTVGGRDALSAELRLSRIGAWHCYAEVDGESPLSGAVVVAVEGVEFSGFVRLSQSLGGKAQAWIVGGNGQLSKSLDARHYTDTNALTVATDICREAGETLASGVSIGEFRLPHWERIKGQASHCLLALCDRTGLAWRVKADGSIWIGQEAWSTVAPKVEVEHEEWTTGTVQVFAEEFSENAKLLPGTTWDGHQLEEVVHFISPGAIRTVVKTDSLSSAINAFLGSIRRKIEMSSSYLCEVVGQNADGTLRLKPLDERIARPGNGLDNVPIRYGLPGFEVKVARGSHVMVEFEGGNPDAPFAALWNQGGDGVTSVEFKPNGLGAPVARIGDEVEVTFPMGLILTTSVGPAALTISTPAKAIITGTGNAKLLA
ncbi:MAG TPA: hypothetical protein VKP30_12360 [Polyangiaceae bacterium]|nr:hypothetical protein [Polyangiaceae bacterium]